MEKEREKKLCDLTYCLPLSNDSVFKRLYSGGGGGCATRHLKINDERSNQTSIRPCPGQIFGGSTGAGLYFIFLSHSRPRPPPLGSHDSHMYRTYILYYYICLYIYILYIYGRFPPTSHSLSLHPIEATKICPGRRYNIIKFCF